ncbi:pregnancy-specific beta-1-glycoprotein 25 [Mus musculus]|uniref:Pregnancy-specific beta-1-glycoprotein 25 n=2 Tax=Mus musculus TaxID=10090 RepID=Q497W1_MOUSE|nr:pregnancy-specific beta-1-glycoprotein 25 [Mus musculus]AAI00353.1 Pregnancy-specific glycoprotein 25 [Mus musculus]|eukprot:NP_473401.1 pregnancy-specific glycoprotein 25 [Mus musculus]
MVVSFELFSKVCTSWQRVLLTASILTYWLLPTTARVIIHSLPLQVVEGENVLLHVYNLPENLLGLAWYRGLLNLKLGIALYSLQYNVSVTGPEHSGRETLHRNGSLWIQNVTQEDTGYYTLRTISKNGKLESNTSMFLQVYSSTFICGHPFFPAKLTIESVPPSVAAGGSVLLRVHNLPEHLQSLFWYKGLIVFNKVEIARYRTAKNSSEPGHAHSGRETVYSNGSLLLQDVTWKDTGFYTLRTLNRYRKMKLAHIYLQVDTPLSLCCDTLDFAQLSIDPVPRYAVEGGSVLLQVHNLPEDLQTFSWYKGVHNTHGFKIAEYSIATKSIISGRAHSRREIGYTDGSLLLQDVTEKDSGLYTLIAIDSNVRVVRAHVQVNVHKLVTQPVVRVTDTTVRVQSSVVFTCFSDNTRISIRWLFNNQNLQLTERMTLSPSKCQLRIHTVRKEDAGEYQCEAFNPVSSKTSLPVSLAVMNE